MVTAALASADGIRYDGAFSTDPVALPSGNLTGLDVRSWTTGLVYLSTSADALNGTPTASLQFNPLLSTAANGQQFQDLIVQQQGSNGETHYSFSAVANLGTSLDNNPYHQITEVFDMTTMVTLQDNSTTTLGNFLNTYQGKTLLGGSVIDNGIIDGGYEIAATPNLGLNGVVFGIQGGLEVEAGFAHQLSAVSESVLLGDVNLDGEVTFADIPAFITVLSAGTFQDEADCDENGEVNFADIPAFIEILIGQ